MMLKKFKGNEILYRKGNEDKHILIYNQWDLGEKYKIYSKHDGNAGYSFNVSFDTLGNALKYFNMIYVA